MNDKGVKVGDDTVLPNTHTTCRNNVIQNQTQSDISTVFLAKPQATWEAYCLVGLSLTV